jgi:hypothetical protein
VPSATPARSFEVRHLQIARALVAAIAAAMITFSPDHSSALGLSVFSGFAILSALVLFLSAWLVFPAGARGPALVLGVIDVIAGMVAGVGPLRSDALFYSVVIGWALASGLAEGIPGLLARRAARTAPARSQARDAVVLGALGVLLGVGLMIPAGFALAVPGGYALHYTVAEAHQAFTLTGMTIAVGVFGGYAAVIAVYLGIAGFSPRDSEDPARAANAAASDEHSGGAA